MLTVEYPQQLSFLDDEKGGRCNGRGRAHPAGLPCHASFAKKIGRTEHGDHSFFPGRIYHRELYTALLDVHDRFRGIALREDEFTSPVFRHFSRYPCGIEKSLRIEGARRSIVSGFLWSHI